MNKPQYEVMKLSDIGISRGYQTNQTLEERFWSKVDKTDDCWIWTGAGNGAGYGHFIIKLNSKWQPFKSHRLAYLLAYNEIPNGMHVLHQCDNTLCVNPEHLFLGNHADNMKDKVLRGRSNKGHRSFHVCKLTWNEVREIRLQYIAGISDGALGRLYGVCHQNIDRIVNYETWKNKEIL